VGNAVEVLAKNLIAEVAETSLNSLRFLCEFCFETRFSGR